MKETWEAEKESEENGVSYILSVQEKYVSKNDVWS